MSGKNICQECHAMVSPREFHTYSHCLIAKAYPDHWREIVKDISGTPTSGVEETKTFSLDDIAKIIYNSKIQWFDRVSITGGQPHWDNADDEDKAMSRYEAQAIYNALPAQRDEHPLYIKDENGVRLLTPEIKKEQCLAEDIGTGRYGCRCQKCTEETITKQED